MFNNNNFNDDWNDYSDAVVNEDHLPVLILADISGSMAGAPIEALNKAINEFIMNVNENKQASQLVDISVVGFNQDVQLQYGFTQARQAPQVNFSANGGTNIPLAVETGIQMIREYVNKLHSLGILCRVPWLVLITDGFGGDCSAIGEVVQKRTNDRKLKLFFLGANGYDKRTATQLTNGVRCFELADGSVDFSSFMEFLSSSAAQLSTSAPGTKIKVDTKIGTEESDVKIAVLDDWLND